MAPLLMSMAARGHDFVDLLVDAVQRDTFGRIDFHTNGEFLLLQFFPEFAFRVTLQDRRRLHGLHLSDGSCLHGPQRLHGFGHGADMRGRGATAAAENAHAEAGGFACEQREIFG